MRFKTSKWKSEMSSGTFSDFALENADFRDVARLREVVRLRGYIRIETKNNSAVQAAIVIMASRNISRICGKFR